MCMGGGDTLSMCLIKASGPSVLGRPRFFLSFFLLPGFLHCRKCSQICVVLLHMYVLINGECLFILYIYLTVVPVL